jgi:hypothetical protein
MTMSEYVKSPKISFKITARGAGIETILSLLERELQTLTTDGEGDTARELAVDLAQRVSGKITVELTVVGDLPSEESTPVPSEGAASVLAASQRCPGVVNLNDANVSLRTERCLGVVHGD